MTPKPAPQATAPHPPGATLHLGGDAYAHPDLASALHPVPDGHTYVEGNTRLTPYPGNPRRGDQDAITASIRDLGLYRTVIVQRSTGYVLAGNHTLRALLDLGAETVPVTWVDVDDARAAAIVVRDNHTSDLAVNDDDALLDLLATLSDEHDLLALSGYDDDDLVALRALASPGPAGTPEPYTRKADPIQYQPTMEVPPSPAELVDRNKANTLVTRIAAHDDLPPDVRDFLIAGAQRHLVFNYAKVAEFYAHATPDVQALMEESALVIIDFADAVQHGYVRLSTRLSDLLDQDQTERTALDAAGVNPGA